MAKQKVQAEEPLSKVSRSTVIEKCPNCGADLEYDPQNLCLKCTHCDTKIPIPGRRSCEISFNEMPIEDLSDKAADVTSYRCNNCGATVSYEGYDIAPECPFCGATNIVKTEELPGLKPTAILPFSRTKEDIVGCYKQWIKRKFFAPRKLKKNFNADKVQGVYLPCFTFDSRVHSIYNARLGKRKTRTVHRNGKTYTETYIEWFKVSGAMDKAIDDLLVEACDMLEQKEIAAIEPFDTFNSVSFDSSYFAGFKATRYNQGLNDSWDIAREIIDDGIRDDIKHRYNADVVDYINLDTYHANTSYKYVMVPVWMCKYTYNKKRYGFIINGRSGKVAGKTPISPLKVCFLVLIGLAVAALAVFLYYKLGI